MAPFYPGALREARTSEVQHLLAFFPRRHEATVLVEREYRLDDRLRLVDHLHEVHVGGRDHAFTNELVLHPREKAAPEFAADEDDRNLSALACLNERQHLAE